MLDKLMKAINHKLDTHTAAVLAQRATIERERAGDTARQHAGREFENSEGFTTPLPKAAQNAQATYARTRRAFEKNGGASALSLAVAMMIARERRDETAAALKKHEEAEARRRAIGVHKEVEPFFDLMFDHGVEPRHLPYVRPETIAIVCDLIRWDGQDPDMQHEDSPMAEVFGVYASRLILKPGQFGARTRSIPGKPVSPMRYTDPRHYRFDELAQVATESPGHNAVEVAGTDAAATAAWIEQPETEDGAPEPLSPARAQAMAEVVYDANPRMLAIYWPKDGVEQDDYEAAKLIPALERWVASGTAWSGAENFLAAARLGKAREFIADRRASGIQRFAKELLDGDERAVADARATGLAV